MTVYSIDNAPRDMEGLRTIKRAALCRLATQLGILADDHTSTSFMQLEDEQKRSAILTALTNYDNNRTNPESTPNMNAPAAPVYPAAAYPAAAPAAPPAAPAYGAPPAAAYGAPPAAAPPGAPPMAAPPGAPPMAAPPMAAPPAAPPMAAPPGAPPVAAPPMAAPPGAPPAAAPPMAPPPVMAPPAAAAPPMAPPPTAAPPAAYGAPPAAPAAAPPTAAPPRAPQTSNSSDNLAISQALSEVSKGLALINGSLSMSNALTRLSVRMILAHAKSMGLDPAAYFQQVYSTSDGEVTQFMEALGIKLGDEAGKG